MVADPQFIDRENNDYHIKASTSPAVDFCDNSMAPALYKDMDNEQRGWDDPSVSDIVGPFDIGYDETYENDIIFQQDFDSVQ
ncbi:MAG: hypothetical protein AB8B80_12220 [Marinicellaceae bacterium]